MPVQINEKIVRKSSVVHALGFNVAVIYFIQHAMSFWIGEFGVLKAIVWPAMVAYKLLEFFKMLELKKLVGRDNPFSRLTINLFCLKCPLFAILILIGRNSYI